MKNDQNYIPEPVADTKKKCLHCGYEWYARVPGTVPKCCPACKSPRWQEKPRWRQPQAPLAQTGT